MSATVVHPGGIKTNIARSSRGDASLEDLGLDAKNARAKFGKLFITDPDAAARVTCAP